LHIIPGIFLGIVQGFTEFLPVSSSGHLVIVSKLFGIPANLPFDIAVHFATLLAVCIFFIGDILLILKAFFIDRDTKSPYFRLGLLVIVASIPTAIIGFSLEKVFEEMFSSVSSVGFFLMLTGLLIMTAEKYGKARKDISKVSFLDSLIVGLAQGCAIAPGLSRSGTTISASLLTGMDRTLACRFSFLLAIPAILGATIFKAKAIFHAVDPGMIAGFIAALVSGYLAIWLFMRMIEKKKINIFAYYCLIVGAITVILSR
jgi:undecaprenyl-diphosphatase